MRNKSTIIRLILTLILVNCCSYLSAQQPVFRSFKINDGLPSNESHAILSDSKGYIWTATDAGICKYDGFNFTTFSLNEGLPESTVLKLYEDKKGRIWFSTLSSFVGYIQNDKIVVSKYQFKHKVNEDERENYAYSFYVDEHDTLWVGTLYSGVLFKLAAPYTSKPIKKEYNSDFIIEFNDGGDFIYSTFYHPVKEKRSELMLVLEQKWLKHTTKLFVNVFPGSTRKEVICLSAGHYIIRGTLQLFELLNDNLIVKQKFDDAITHTSIDKHKNLWIGFSKNGIYKLKLSSFLSKKSVDLKKYESYFPRMYVTDMVNDFEGGYWFSTLADGLMYMPSSDFKSIISNNSRTEYLGVYPWIDNQIVVNELFGDIIILEDEKVIHRFPINAYSFFPFSKLKQIYLFTPIVSSPTRPQLLEKKGDKYIFENQVSYTPKRLNHSYLKQFHEHKGKYYAAVNYEIYAYRPAQNNFNLICKSANRLNDFLVDDKQILWIAGVKGLVSYDIRKKKWKYWGKYYKDLHTRFESIVEDGRGNLWLGTRGKGLIFFDKKQEIKIWDKQKGLPSNIVRKIYLDKQNQLWIATNLGLSLIKTNLNDKIFNFTYLNSFNIGNINNILKQDDYLYMATSQGMYKLSTKQLRPTLFYTQKPLYITRVENGQKELVRAGSEINYHNNFLKFSFVAISYAHATNSGYQYMIKGIDRQWRSTNNTYVEYPNLPSGSYTFMVKIAGANPKKAGMIQKFNFKVSEPYWQSAWFIVCNIMLGLFIVSWIIRWRIHVVQRNERLAAQVKIDLASMEAKALRAQMNPHFIFNSLGSIQYYILQNETELADFYLGKFSKLIRQILESSKNELISLSHEIDLLENYIQLDNMRHNNSLIHEINYSNDIDTANIWIPNMIIQPYVENSILHGLAPLQERKGRLSIRFFDQGAIVKCIVEDNGIGREAAEIIKKNKIRYHQSISTSLNAERLRLYNKMYHTKAEIRYEDLYDEHKKPIGTRVILLIPVIKRL